MVIKQIENTPISSNCFVIFDKAVRNNCIIVDPGSEDNSDLFRFLEKELLNPEYIILTHEHFDHCWGVNSFRNKYPDVKLISSKICSDSIQDRKKNYSVFNQQPGFELKPADIILDDIDWKLVWYDKLISFLPAQGHSASGIVIFVDQYVFTGDSLIKGIKTVTKLKTASKEKLMKTLSMLEAKKGRGFVVCPGHGEMFSLDGYDLSLAISCDG